MVLGQKLTQNHLNKKNRRENLDRENKGQLTREV